MSFKFSFHLGTLLFFALFMFLIPFAVCAADPIPLTSAPWYSFLQENWAIIALVLSETLAFLPVKAQGIAQGVITVFNAIFKKKSLSKSQSR